MEVSVLVVEDKSEFAEEIAGIIAEEFPDARIVFAADRATAKEKLETDLYDLVSLDLKLPKEPASLDLDADYGLDVLNHLLKVSPGTPVVILTGSPSEKYIDDFLEKSERLDVWSCGTPMPTISFVKKDDLDKFGEKIVERLQALRGLTEVDNRAGADELDPYAARIIRILCRRIGALTFSCKQLGGGLSGSSIYQVHGFSENGTEREPIILKVGDREMTATEEKNYKLYIDQLPPEATPRFARVINFGAGNASGVAYSLASGHDDSAFDLAVGEGSPEDALKTLKGHIGRWSEGVPEKRVSIAEIRALMLDEQQLTALIAEYGLGDWDQFERRQVQCRWSPIHGDMHGMNILVDTAKSRPALIDYGDMTEGPAAFDWIVLELSLIFHANGPLRAAELPTLAQCEQWINLDAFIDGLPCEAFIRLVRGFASELAVSQQELAACAYAYVVRQLKYDDTDKDRAVAIIRGLRDFLAS